MNGDLTIKIKPSVDYYTENISITGSYDNPQTIYYSELSGFESQSIPSKFNPIPIIFIGSIEGDVEIRIIERTNTYFKVAQSQLRGDRSLTAVNCNFHLIQYYADITQYEIENTLIISETLTTESSQCTLSLRDTPFIIREGMEIVVAIGSETIFGGIIQSAPRNPLSGFNAWQYQLTCTDYSAVFDYRRVAEVYQNKTLKYIAEEIISNYVAAAWGITTNNIATGPTFEEITFNYFTVRECIQKLAELANYSWYVDYDKDVHVFAKETSVAPYSIIDTSAFKFFGFYIEADSSQVRNKVMVSGGKFLSPPVSETFTGDGTQDEYTLNDKPSQMSVTEGGTSKSIGIVNINDPATVDYVIDYWRQSVRRTAGNLPNGVDLVVSYSYNVKVVGQAEDKAAQAYFMDLEGGDGVREFRIVDDTITSIPEAHQTALQQVRDFGYPKIHGGFSTYEDGFAIGQLLTVNLTDDPYNGEYQITFITKSVLKNSVLQYDIAFSARRTRIEDILVGLLRKSDITTQEAGEGIDKLKYISEDIEFADTVGTELIALTDQKWGPAATTIKWNFGTWQ